MLRLRAARNNRWRKRMVADSYGSGPAKTGASDPGTAGPRNEIHFALIPSQPRFVRSMHPAPEQAIQRASRFPLFFRGDGTV